MALLLIVMEVLTASIITKAEGYVNEANGLLLAIGMLIGTAIGVWQQISTQRKKDELRNELAQTTSGLILEAKSNSIGLLQTLKTPPDVNFKANPDESKNLIVSQALKEREPNKLKKLKLNDLLSIGNFVSNVYQQAKPFIKAIKD
jgi:hypothetical protein